MPDPIVTVNVPPATIVDATTPVAVTGTPTGVPTASFPSPGSNYPTYTPTALVGLPGGAAPMSTGTVVPAGTLDDPLYSRMVFPELHENVGGAIIGSLIIFCILSLVIKSQLRMLLVGAWLVAVILVVFTGLLVWVYGWLLLVAALGWVDGIRSVFGMERSV